MHRNRPWTRAFGVPALLVSVGVLIAAALAGGAAAAGSTGGDTWTTSGTSSESTSSETTPSGTTPSGTTPSTTTPTSTTTTTATTTPTSTTTTTTSTTTTTAPPGGEGCTPGFWKNHPEAFEGTGYTGSTTLGSVFTGLTPAYAGLTFDQALRFGGGGLNALLRHAVAALLNAASPDVDYPLTTTEVINATNAAIASGDYEATKDAFDSANNLGSPGFCD